jgi:hypothetical protein
MLLIIYLYSTRATGVWRVEVSVFTGPTIINRTRTVGVWGVSETSYLLSNPVVQMMIKLIKTELLGLTLHLTLRNVLMPSGSQTRNTGSP